MQDVWYAYWVGNLAGGLSVAAQMNDQHTPFYLSHQAIYCFIIASLLSITTANGGCGGQKP